MADKFLASHGAGPTKKIVVYRAMVTGANTGLGYAICCRLLDMFLDTRELHEHIHLIVATRSREKCETTMKALRQHMEMWKNKQISDGNGRFIQDILLKESQADPSFRVSMSGEVVDLCDLVSVRALADRLVNGRNRRNSSGDPIGDKPDSKIDHLDVLFCNAGIGGWDGLNWSQAIKDVLKNVVQAVTWPRYKKNIVGVAASPQFRRGAQEPDGEGETQEKVSDQPPLGQIFCSNLFGHYLLGHYLTGLLSNVPASQEAHGRIIWISSLEAYDYTLDLNDIQGLKALEPYESSKRLTDLLALSSELKTTAPWVSNYLRPSSISTPQNSTSANEGEDDGTDQPTGAVAEKPALSTSGSPRIYLAHPGICATGIANLPFILHIAMILAFYLARILGSPWHTVKAYVGAAAPVYLALVPQPQLDEVERKDGLGKAKWGSGTNQLGTEMVSRTEVEGWGLGGKIGTDPNDWEMKRIPTGPVQVARVVGREEREEFEVRAMEAWREMEALREEWEGLIEAEWERRTG